MKFLRSIIRFFIEFPYRRFAKACLNMVGQFLHWVIFRCLLPKKWRGVSKRGIYDVIFKSDTPAGKKFDIYLLVAIGINLLLLIIESSPRITGWGSIALRVLGWLFTLAFTLEYYLRIYCLRRPLKYVFSFYGIIDFLSIFPAYLSLFLPATQTLSVLRILRALRIFRILKMQRFIDEGGKLISVLQRSAYRIAIFMLFTFLVSVILGALMYMFENTQNEAFNSIPEGIYWAVVTITTVGYGDITPVTMAGRFISIAVMLLGYSIIAVPSGIIAGEVIQEHKVHKATPVFHDDDYDDTEDAVLSDVEASSDDDTGTDATPPQPAKRCPHCGYEEHDATADYCSRCGTRLSKVDDHSWINDFFA